MKLVLLLLLLAEPVARAQPALCAHLRDLTAEPAVAAAHWGLAVESLDGHLLCGINQAQLFRPASNAKLFTAGAALALLGPDATVSTYVSEARRAAGGPSPATLDGDLILHGAGDALLSDRPLPYAPPTRGAAPTPRENPLHQLARLVAAGGTTHITGDIVATDELFPDDPYPADWSLDDIRAGYGAPVSALAVDDNKLTLSVTPGARPGDPAQVGLQPDAGFYSVTNSVTTVPAATPAHVGFAYIPGSPRQLLVSGTVAAKAPYVEDIAITDPALYAAVRLKAMLEDAGVTVDGAARAQHMPAAQARELERRANSLIMALPSAAGAGKPQDGGLQGAPSAEPSILSPPLLEDLTVTLKVSQNLHAELLLRRLGLRFTGSGSTAQGVRVVRQFWLNAGLPAEDFRLFDGSGLSDHDLTTPRALAQLLVFAATQPWFAGFKAALPVGGVDGSLAGRFAGSLQGRIFAKTGTLGESRALSGYLTAASGRTLVFSILVDNHLPTSTADRTTMDRMVELIAAAN